MTTDIHPKIAAIVPIDAYWAIEDGAKEKYLEQIAGVNLVEASKRQAEVFAATSARVASSDKPYEVIDGNAIISLEGPLTKKPTSMSWLIGGASTAMARQAVREASKDKDVKRVIIAIDSPGGQVDGTEQLGAEIRAASAAKPFIAFINGTCASAALWIACCCDEIWASGKTDTVGSIGVITSITDVSRLYENAGIKVDVVSSGVHKGTGTRGTAVTPEQRAEVQRHIDDLAGNFKQAVAAGRGMSDEQIGALADGRYWTAERALALGLIDGIATFDQLLSRTPTGRPGAQRPAATVGNGEPMATEKPSLLERVAALFKEEGIATDAASQAQQQQPAATTTIIENPETTRALAEAQKQLAELGASKRQADAEAFVTALTTGKDAKFLPAVSAELTALHLLAQQIDAGQKPEGSFTAALQAFVDKQPTAVITKEQMMDNIDSSGGAVILKPTIATEDQAQIKAAQDQAKEWAQKQNGKAARGKGDTN